MPISASEQEDNSSTCGPAQIISAVLLHSIKHRHLLLSNAMAKPCSDFIIWLPEACAHMCKQKPQVLLSNVKMHAQQEPKTRQPYHMASSTLHSSRHRLSDITRPNTSTLSSTTVAFFSVWHEENKASGRYRKHHDFMQMPHICCHRLMSTLGSIPISIAALENS